MVETSKSLTQDVSLLVPPRDERARRWRARRGLAIIVVLILLGTALAGYLLWKPTEDKNILRFGYFPNITHSQALIGLETGLIRNHTGPGVKIEEYQFNAGPSAIEAMFAGKLDITYIGPSPTINGYVKSDGKALRVIAGGCSGGAILVARPGSGINSTSDLSGKKIASPQLGNTQDVALRHYLKNAGIKTTEESGSTEVVNVANSDILILFKKGELDAAWVPEPWGSRLIHEANAKLLLDERDLWPGGAFITTNIIVSTEFLQKKPQIVRAVLEAHVEATIWMNENPAKARAVVNKELERITGKALSETVLNEAYSRMNTTWDPVATSLSTYSDWAYELGFLGATKPDIGKLYSLGFLNDILKAKGLPAVS